MNVHGFLCKDKQMKVFIFIILDFMMEVQEA